MLEHFITVSNISKQHYTEESRNTAEMKATSDIILDNFQH